MNAGLLTSDNERWLVSVTNTSMFIPFNTTFSSADLTPLNPFNSANSSNLAPTFSCLVNNKRIWTQ